MKKTYITPALNVVELRGIEHQMLATSIYVGPSTGQDTEDAWTREQENDFDSDSDSFWQ